MHEALLSPVQHFSWLDGLTEPYFLDSASARSLRSGIQLVSNEFSRDRRQRLLGVFERYLPEETSTHVALTGYDASRWSGYKTESFDAVLLDVPCSSERQVFSSPAHLSQWSASRIRFLA